jgi:hypothetical protein
MAKYFSFYVTSGVKNNFNPYSVYYDQVNENNYATRAYTDHLMKNYVLSLPGELPYFVMNVEVPDSATSVIVKSLYETQTFPLVSTPPTIGTLFLTFDIID